VNTVTATYSGGKESRQMAAVVEIIIIPAVAVVLTMEQVEMEETIPVQDHFPALEQMRVSGALK